MGGGKTKVKHNKLVVVSTWDMWTFRDIDVFC